jgi:hypothetical protein
MPMQPSTHVTHIPELGATESSVRFFVNVAADEFILERVMDIMSPPLPISIFLDLTSETGWAQIGAASADRLIRLCVSASERAGRADIYATAALTTGIGGKIKRRADAATLPTPPEADGLGHHLLFAHADAQPA